jgi:hypothetical protein
VIDRVKGATHKAKEEVKCASMNIKGTIWSKRSMCMFEHIFSKFQNTRLAYMTSKAYGIQIKCKWFDLNDTSPNDAQTSSPSEINLV